MPLSRIGKRYVFETCVAELTSTIRGSTVSFGFQEEMRTCLKNLKKELDDKERAVKAAVAGVVADEVKTLCIAQPNVPVIVRELKAESNTKVRWRFHCSRIRQAAESRLPKGYLQRQCKWSRDKSFVLLISRLWTAHWNKWKPTPLRRLPCSSQSTRSPVKYSVCAQFPR